MYSFIDLLKQRKDDTEQIVYQSIKMRFSAFDSKCCIHMQYMYTV